MSGMRVDRPREAEERQDAERAKDQESGQHVTIYD
jgi:hypothetical protein